MHRFDQQHAQSRVSTPSWGVTAPQNSWDGSQLAREQAQVAREQAQRLYSQQIQRQQQHTHRQQHLYQRSSLGHDTGGQQGYSNSLDAFGWDDAPVTHPMQYSAAQFSRQPTGSHLDSRQQHPSLLARQGFSSELRQRDVGSGDLNSGMSLPNSSGTENMAGGGSRGGPNKRKGGKSRKAPANESHVMQRCLEVVEQLLEEEDAEPFAEPVNAKALGLPDYHQVIRQPMDLGTIKENLQAEPPAYFSSTEVLKDIQQVWSNCRTYNDEDDPIIDMCDNMERFFYQAWKEQGLQLPPGAGPTLSRRPSKSKAPNSSWEEPQANRGHKRQHAASYFEDDDLGGFDQGSMHAAQSMYPGNEASNKRYKGMTGNSAATATASSYRDGPLGPKRKSGAMPSEPVDLPPLAPVQLSAQEQEAEKSDKEAIAAWDSLQKQRTKAQAVIQAAQDAVRKLEEAKATLDDIHKAAAAQEAAQAAAEALHPWPSDARLVPATHPAYPPEPPQILHPELATLGSYLLSLPGGISNSALQAASQEKNQMQGSISNSAVHAASQDRNQTQNTEDGSAHDQLGHMPGASRNSWPRQSAANRGDNNDQQQHQQQQQQQQRQQQSLAGQDSEGLTGWQRRLQSGMSSQQLQQIVAGRFMEEPSEPAVVTGS